MKHLLPLLVAIACGLSEANAAPLRVVSLSTITTELAREVGGSELEVLALVRPGSDPHEFQPTPADLRKIGAAALVLGTGKGLEGYLTKIEQTVGGKTRLVLVGQHFPSLKMEEDGREIEDPHWWHSIAHMIQATRIVRDTLISLDKTHREKYEKNAEIYLARLDQLSTWAKIEISALPREKRKLVTSHDAFQYFARDFGFKIYAVEGVGPQDQPSSRHVRELIEMIKKEQVKAIFAENIENPKVLQALTRETNIKLGGILYPDGLGEGEANTYEKMMKHNITTIVSALK
jgi:zinc/manganese transport system substrate-binding protein